MRHEVYARVTQASRARGATVYLRPPCDAGGSRVFADRVRDELGADDGVGWYMALRRVSDGLQIGDSFFDSAHDFVETNIEQRAMDAAHYRYLIFGYSGNVDLYVLDTKRADDTFCVVNFYDVGGVHEAYASIEGSLAALSDAESAA